MIATESNKPKRAVRILEWVLRPTPVCPDCRKKMHRNGQCGATLYWRCVGCGLTAKSRERVE